MCSICHVVDKNYDAAVAISRDRDIGYEVDIDSLPVAFGYSKWLLEAVGFPEPVVRSMAKSLPPRDGWVSCHICLETYQSFMN